MGGIRTCQLARTCPGTRGSPLPPGTLMMPASARRQRLVRPSRGRSARPVPLTVANLPWCRWESTEASAKADAMRYGKPRSFSRQNRRENQRSSGVGFRSRIVSADVGHAARHRIQRCGAGSGGTGLSRPSRVWPVLSASDCLPAVGPGTPAIPPGGGISSCCYNSCSRAPRCRACCARPE